MKWREFAKISIWQQLIIPIMTFSWAFPFSISGTIVLDLSEKIDAIGIGTMITGFVSFIVYLCFLITYAIIEVKKEIVFGTIIVIVVCNIVGLSMIIGYTGWIGIEKIAYTIMEIVALVAGISVGIIAIKAFKKEKEREKEGEAKKN
ncbi:MAG: hypothetical protein KGD64_11875 [Candidatus Heimdallarchaeota archaeon]|nr:hypothetical protein [Candidatus Heimdallarchaeota archaeon]